MIETRLLNYFLAIAREENITAAAKILHVTQPTLSKQMMELEEQLGCRLFRRGKKHITLTDEGQYFRRRAQEILSLLSSTEEALQSSEQFIKGDIVLGCGETNKMESISKIFKRMHLLYPEIRFHLFSANTEAILEKMDQGLIDIGLLLDPPDKENYSYIDIGQADCFGLLMSKNHPLAERDRITMEDLKKIPLILPSQTFSRYEKKVLPIEDSELNIIARYNLIYNAAYLAEQDIGCALTLSGLIQTEGRNLTFRLLTPEICRPWKLAIRKYQPQSPAVKVFLQMLQQEIKNRNASDK